MPNLPSLTEEVPRPKDWVSGQEPNEVVVGDLSILIGDVEIYHGPDQLNIAVALADGGEQVIVSHEPIAIGVDGLKAVSHQNILDARQRELDVDLVLLRRPLQAHKHK